MEKPSQSVFAKAMLSAVRMLMQGLTSWLVMTSNWNARVVSLVCNALCFQVKGTELDMFQCIENS